MYLCIDVLLTLRCNAACVNCSRGCNADFTGLDLSASDMTVEQITAMAGQIEDVYREIGRPVTEKLNLSGGEALLHPRLDEIVSLLEERLLRPGIIRRLTVGTNGLLPPPPVAARFAECLCPVRDKPGIHTAVWIDPADRDPRPPAATWHRCTMEHRHVAVASWLGWSLCCYADGYLRLFRATELLLDRLPWKWEQWPLDAMRAVCGRCVHGHPPVSYERDVGRPLSAIYRQAGEANRRLPPLQGPGYARPRLGGTGCPTLEPPPTERTTMKDRFKTNLRLHEGVWIHAEADGATWQNWAEVYRNDVYRMRSMALWREEEVIVDVGASTGPFAKLAHERNPNARIFCVEVCPENIPALHRNVGGFAQVIHAACTYEPADRIALHNSAFAGCVNTGGSIVAAREEVAAATDARYRPDLRPLRTISLEEIREVYGLDRIDILKLDCEGSEFSILEHTDLSCVEQIVGEWHGLARFDDLCTRVMRGAGFHLTVFSGGEIGIFWLSRRSNLARLGIDL